MLTKTKPVLDVPVSDSEYPPELMDLWRSNSEVIKAKRASGEIKPKSLREAAAERGIAL